jgi:hypothetical protein
LATIVEPEYRSAARYVSEGVLEGEHHVLITPHNYIVDFLKLFEIDLVIGLIVTSNWGRVRV